VLEMTEHEKASRELDKAFPRAAHKEMVEFEGKR
jgi:hypothetical protein